MKYYIYILRNPSNKLYIGHTNHIPQRLERHGLGEASLFTKQHKNFKLVYSEEYQTQLEAMHREKQIKGWSRAKKEALIQADHSKLRDLSQSREER